jgi:ParB/Sulfiredoxin domain
LLKKPAYTALELRDAIADAERRFVAPDPKKARKGVKLKLGDIKVRPELFQPREFLAGLREVDPDHVNTLAQSIGIYGELDPILVIKIGDDWVCVDGHHRLEAYKWRKYSKPVNCEWFSGSVREAADESMRRNSKDKLAVSKADRMEGAWKRVLLDLGSKKEIAKLCGVGTSTVAEMRRVKKRYEEDQEFAQRLARGSWSLKEPGLLMTSWDRVRMALRNVEPQEADLEEQAGRLARTVNRRLTDLLLRDYRVTARVLEKISPNLRRGLMEVWSGHEAAPQIPRAPLSDNQLRLQRRALQARIASIEAELEGRERKRQALSARQDAEAALQAWVNDGMPL